VGKPLSEVLKFSSTDLKVWLEKETGSIFSPVHAKAQKLVDDMRKSIGALSETSKMLLDNSGKEIEKRNMRVYKRARALNKLAKIFIDRMRQINVPEKVTYESFSTFVQETQKAFTVTEVDIRNWFPRISPFFILDRRRFLTVFEKAKLLWKELESFQTKEYVKTKTLEETFQLIDKLTMLEKQLKEVGERKTKVAGDVARVEKEIAETQIKIANLKTIGGIGQLSLTGSEIEALTLETKHSLRHLQKPFIKLQALATHGSGSGLTPEEHKKLMQYLGNPFEALATEETGYPLLKQILEKLGRSISEDKLKLKLEKARKAEQAINNVTKNNSLATLQQRCKTTSARKTQLSTSEEVASTQKDLAKLNEHAENLKRSKGVFETEEISVGKNHSEIADKIRNAKGEIEKNTLSFMGRKVTVT
jgi:hypothetical protein